MLSKSSNALDGSAIRHLFPSGNHCTNYSGENEWSTPEKYIELARQVRFVTGIMPADVSG